MSPIKPRGKGCAVRIMCCNRVPGVTNSNLLGKLTLTTPGTSIMLARVPIVSQLVIRFCALGLEDTRDISRDTHRSNLTTNIFTPTEANHNFGSTGQVGLARMLEGAAVPRSSCSAHTSRRLHNGQATSPPQLLQHFRTTPTEPLELLIAG